MPQRPPYCVPANSTPENVTVLYAYCLYNHSYPRQTGADLGFYEGGCPINLKGAPEGAKPPTWAPTAGLYGGDVGSSPENLKIHSLSDAFSRLETGSEGVSKQLH